MTIREALAQGTARLQSAGVPDARLDAELLLARVLREDRLRMRLDGARCLSDAQTERYDALLCRRQMREPLQYIEGEAAFMGLSFRVAPGVLIPRQDTEILCEEALSRIKPGARVLDIGTGSGALAVSLAKLGDNAQVTAVDVSDIALSIARDNARRLVAQVRFLHSDCFAAVAGETFDLIVSNPPYISREEMETLMPEVRREPELALAGGEDGLDYYRRIAREAPAHLNKGGCLLFEIGWQQRDAVSALVRESVGEPFSLKDYGGNWRVVGALRR